MNKTTLLQDLRSAWLTSHDPGVAQLGPQVGTEQTGPQFIQGLSEFFGLDL